MTEQRLAEIDKEKKAIVVEAKKLSTEGRLTPVIHFQMMVDMYILINEEKKLKAKVEG